jgi:hypothetical protein
LSELHERQIRINNLHRASSIRNRTERCNRGAGVRALPTLVVIPLVLQGKTQKRDPGFSYLQPHCMEKGETWPKRAESDGR